LEKKLTKVEPKFVRPKVLLRKNKAFNVSFLVPKKDDLKLGGTGCSALAVAVVLKAADGTTFISHPCLLQQNPKNRAQCKNKNFEQYYLRKSGTTVLEPRKDLVTPCCII